YHLTPAVRPDTDQGSVGLGLAELFPDSFDVACAGVGHIEVALGIVAGKVGQGESQCAHPVGNHRHLATLGHPHHGFFHQVAVDQGALAIHGNAVGQRTGGQGDEFAHFPFRADFINDTVTASTVYVPFLVNDDTL